MNPSPNAAPNRPNRPARWSGSVTSAIYANDVAKLDAVIPESTRPRNSHPTVGASAMMTWSSPRPRHDTRITGRRPTRSDSAPSTGANRNCIAAHTVPNTPYSPAALVSLPPSSWMTSFGKTGAMIPSASMSSRTVPKMNQKVARRMCDSGAMAGVTITPEAGAPQNRRTGAPS